ncbi:hypothetical protein NB717_002364 [Xanthomonas sacchari]|nr:hypothetical protein [Xanthomonas sacchari]MCW0463457.1 hypothetical protein [Xanthomonas sacchari]
MHAQVLAQVAGDDHAHAVVHPAGVPQLAQAGIDDRHAGASALPGVQCRRIGLGPAKALEARIEVALGRVREMVQQVVGEIAPAQLADVAVDRRGGGGAALPFQRRDDAPWRDLAEMQVRRQPRGTDLVGAVAAIEIVAQRAVDEHVQRLVCARLARLPDLPEAAVPVQRRRQAESLQRQAVQILGRRWQRLRRGLQRGHLPMAQGAAPERGEHLVRAALLRRQLPGFEQQRAVVAVHLQALFAQFALEPRIARLRGRLVAAVPVHRHRAAVGDHLAQGGLGRALAQDQARTARAQLRVQCRQRALQPTARSRAGGPCALVFRAVQIHRHRRMPGIQSGLQGRLIVQAQVAPEPDDGVAHAKGRSEGRAMIRIGCSGQVSMRNARTRFDAADAAARVPC